MARRHIVSSGNGRSRYYKSPIFGYDLRDFSGAQPAISPSERLREWHSMAEGAYAANTLRAQKADGAIFLAFCEGRGESFLPADPTTIRAFIEHEVRVGKKPRTVRRYIATLDIDLAAITQAGGWNSTRMPLQYAEKINAARSGMARAAAATGVTSQSRNKT